MILYYIISYYNILYYIIYYPPSWWTPSPAIRPNLRTLVFKVRTLMPFSVEPGKNLVPQGGPCRGSLWDASKILIRVATLLHLVGRGGKRINSNRVQTLIAFHTASGPGFGP